MSRIEDILARKKLGLPSGYELPKKKDLELSQCSSCGTVNALYHKNLNDTICQVCHYSEGFKHRLSDEEYVVYIVRSEPMTDSDGDYVWPPLLPLGCMDPKDYDEGQRDVIMKSQWWIDQYGDLYTNIQHSWLDGVNIGADAFSLRLSKVKDEYKVCDLDKGFDIKPDISN